MAANLIILGVILVAVVGVGIFAFVFIGGDTNASKAGLRDLMGGVDGCLLYTSPSPRDLSTSRMPSSA